jgi:hypothetical protein
MPRFQPEAGVRITKPPDLSHHGDNAFGSPPRLGRRNVRRRLAILLSKAVAAVTGGNSNEGPSTAGSRSKNVSGYIMNRSCQPGLGRAFARPQALAHVCPA